MATPALAAFKKGIADPDFNAALPVVPKEKAKEDILAESGLNIARPKGISTIAGDGSTPFVPPKSTGSVPASQPQQDNAWTRALAGTVPLSSPNAPVVNNPTMPQMLKSHGTATLAMPPTTAAAGAKPAVLSAADTLADTAGLTPSPIKQSIAGPLVMLDGKKGLGDTSAISRRVDWSPGSANVRAGIADVKYNEEVAKATQANAAQSDMLANRGIAQRFNDLSSNNTTWSLKDPQKLSIANMEFAAGQKGIADEKDLTGKKYTADQSLAGTVYAADQSTQTHKYNADQALAGNKYVADQKRIVDEEELQQKVKAALQPAAAKGSLTQKDIIDGAHTEAYKSAAEMMKQSMTTDPAERQKEFERYYHDSRLKFLNTYKQMTAGAIK